MAIEVTGRRQLEHSLRGQLVWPESADYDLARAVYNGAIDRRPALIVRPLDAADVAAAVEFARAERLAVSVRGGGHSVAGHAVADDALMIDLRLMRDVRVDAPRRRADAGGGATWNDVDPRPDARRRHRAPDRAVRADARQPRRGRGHHGRRPRRRRERRAGRRA